MAPAIIPTTTTGGVSAGQPPPPQQQPAAANLDDPANVRRWLRTNHPRQLALLNDFEVGSRLGRTSASSSSSRGGGGDTTVVGSSSAAGGSGTYRYGRERLPMAARTVELLRSIVGATRWTNAAQLLTLLRGLGNELGGNGRRDPAIGNVIRRVMYAVRDEADRGLAEECDGDGDGGGAGNAVTAAGGLSGSRRESFLSSMLWAHPQQPVVNMGRHKREQSSGGGGGGVGLGEWGVITARCCGACARNPSPAVARRPPPSTTPIPPPPTPIPLRPMAIIPRTTTRGGTTSDRT